MEWKTVREQLAAPFPASEIKWRVGVHNGKKSKGGYGWEKEPTVGLPLAYIDARAVMDRLDEVVGPKNWSCQFQVTPTKNLCALTVLGVTKMDGAEDTDFEGPKGGLSDAFKRSAVHFGVGRYLYRLGDQKWLPVEAKGKYVNFVNEPKLPAWALPKEELAEVVEMPREEPEPEQETPQQRQKMISSMEQLFNEGHRKLGIDKFSSLAGAIIAVYTDGDWRKLPINKARELYTDISEMIEKNPEV